MRSKLNTVIISLVLAGCFAGTGLAVTGRPAAAQAPVTQNATATATATITAIDYTQRVVALKFADGTTKTVQVGPEVTRFPQLKVGDTVTFTSTESLVYSIAKPGATPPPDTAAASTAAGDKPGGTATKTKSTIVTVTAIDPSIPSITFKTADGQVASFKVKDPKNIVGVKVGDQVQITYSTSVMISVK